MTSGRHARWDRRAVAVVLVVVAVAVGYVWLVVRQGDRPVAWFVGGLVLSVVLAGYGAARAGSRRRAALVVSGTVLVVLGVLGLASVGLPLLAAGVVLLWAAVRRRGRG